MNRWDQESGPLIRIKICGVTEIEHVEAAAEAGADAIGIVMTHTSPRCVSPDQAQRLADAAPSTMATVTLLVDPDTHALHHRPSPWVQLHGHENAQTIEEARLHGPVIRGISATNLNAIQEADQNRHVDRLLIDGPQGGGGSTFDHNAFGHMASRLRTPWILAGGLDPDNVTSALHVLHPWGVDVSSGVESQRGVKDIGKIHAFCQAVRSGDCG